MSVQWKVAKLILLQRELLSDTSEAHVSCEGTPVFGSDLTSFRVVPTEAAKTRRVHLRQSAQFLASPSVYITRCKAEGISYSMTYFLVLTNDCSSPKMDF